ncbi:serpin family protein [Hymenobacter saemangeumensis]
MFLTRIKTTLLGLAGAAALFTACQKETVAPPPTGNVPNLRPLTAAERQTVGSANDFAYRAFGALRQGAPAANLFISPLSISAALTMAYNGADGSTKTAMKSTLGFTPLTDLEINQAYQGLFGLLGGLDNRVRFTVANSIWHGEQYQLAAPFVQKNQTYFNASVRGVNFASPTTANTINSWVSASTQGKIPTILDGTSADDVMYLINALYFKGDWTYRFDPQLTRREPFQLEGGGSTLVDMMMMTRGKYLKYQDGQQQVIDLPYGNKQFSMTLIVPQGTATLADVAGRLSAGQLATWLARADSTTWHLHLPKFRLAYEQELNQTLTQLGMGVAFGGQANFSQMLANGATNLAISSVKHKAVLEVNEEGSEAAAVTSVGVGTTSLPPAVYINRPFLFLIREKASNAVLFMGQLTNP